jgi:hypothetical protein
MGYQTDAAENDAGADEMAKETVFARFAGIFGPAQLHKDDGEQQE